MTCLGIWSLKGCHASVFLGSASPKGPRRSSCLDLPRGSILGRPSRLDLPRDSISKRLSRLSLPGDLHPDPGTPGSQVATVLGRMSLHHGIFPSTVDKLPMSYKPLNSTQHWSRWRPWGRPNSSPGVPGGHHGLTCLGIWSLKSCHASACLEICILTLGCLALRLPQYWVR